MTNLNQALKDAASIRADMQRASTEKIFAETMMQIDLEIEQHGIYPYNNGKLNQRELCLRAKLFPTILNQPSHKNTTRLAVHKWLNQKKTKTIKVAKHIALTKIDYWKEEHKKVASQIVVYELERVEHELEVRRLLGENHRLREQLSQHLKNNIFPLNPNSKK